MDARGIHRVFQSASNPPNNLLWTIKLIITITKLDFLYLFRPQLETDSNILIPKARTSLERYGHQLVIGNLLNTRKYEVVLVSRKELIGVMEQTPSEHNGDTSTSIAATLGEEQVHLERTQDGDFVQNWLRLREGRTEIEEDLIAQLVKYHEAWIQTPNKQKRSIQ